MANGSGYLTVSLQRHGPNRYIGSFLACVTFRFHDSIIKYEAIVEYVSILAFGAFRFPVSFIWFGAVCFFNSLYSNGSVRFYGPIPFN